MPEATATEATNHRQPKLLERFLPPGLAGLASDPCYLWSCDAVTSVNRLGLLSIARPWLARCNRELRVHRRLRR